MVHPAERTANLCRTPSQKQHPRMRVLSGAGLAPTPVLRESSRPTLPGLQLCASSLHDNPVGWADVMGFI